MLEMADDISFLLMNEVPFFCMVLPTFVVFASIDDAVFIYIGMCLQRVLFERWHAGAFL